MVLTMAAAMLSGCFSAENIPALAGTHCAYSDGQTIFGRSADSVVGLVDAPEQQLLEPGSVEGLSLTSYKGSRWVAWLEDDDQIKIVRVPGNLDEASIVTELTGENVHAFTRPGLATDGSTLYVSTSLGATAMLHRSIDGGITWEFFERVDLPFDVGSTDIAIENGEIWVAVSTRNEAAGDQVLIFRMGSTSHALSFRFFSIVTAFPAAIDGARGVRIAIDGDRIAVSCVSRPRDKGFAGVAENRQGVVAFGEIVAANQVEWNQLTCFLPNNNASMRCPPALLFESPALESLFVDGRDDEQSIVRVRPEGSDSMDFENLPAMTVQDVALAHGRAFLTPRRPGRILEQPPFGR
jgi:hypothetical protein